MQTLSTNDWTHLKEVEFHPELLCKQLFRLWTLGGGTLRWQYCGGTPDGIYLFCECAALTDAIQVEWQNGEYVPKHHRNLSDLPGMNDLLSIQTIDAKRANPTRFKKILDLVSAWIRA